MNCRNFDKLIGPFIENKGYIKDTKEFISHFDKCEQCRNEFETDFYTFWGLKMLNNPDTDSYNIAEEMNKTITNARDKIKYDRIVTFVFVFVVLLAIAGLTIFLFNY